ncbi:PLRG1 regulator, partial [Sylvietta virens]|nr:PLRG1 regulator [Sylvietta virens]
VAGDAQEHSEHQPGYRSWKRPRDTFGADYGERVPLDEESHQVKRAFQERPENGSGLHMPTLQESLWERGGPSSWDPHGYKQSSGNQGGDAQYMVTLTQAYPSGPDVTYRAIMNVHRMPTQSSAGAQSSVGAVPAYQSRLDEDWTAPRGCDIYRRAGISEPSQLPGMSMPVREAGGYRNSALMPEKAPTMPKLRWHRPWKLHRVISGHLDCVRGIAVEPGNEWFVTGSADRTIRIWDLASGELRLSLSAHTSTVRGVAVSARQLHLFSCGGHAELKCWDLEYRKVIREYTCHETVVNGLDLHPTLDVLVTCGDDATAQIWDARTKASMGTLRGHTRSVAAVKCHREEAQVVTGSHDTTVRIWDLVAGRTRVTLTDHRRSARAVVLHPRDDRFASGSPGLIKQWKFPDGEFIQDLSEHNAMINALAVSSEGILASGAADGSLHFWDWRTGYNFHRIVPDAKQDSSDKDSAIFACVFDQSGRRLLTAGADKTIKVYKEHVSQKQRDNKKKRS